MARQGIAGAKASPASGAREAGLRSCLPSSGESAQVGAMHLLVARSLTLAALSARGLVLAGNDNNRANNNANRWRARA